MRFHKRAGLLAASLLLFCTNSWAETILLPLTDDAWINANNPSSNFGTVDDIFVHSWGPKEGLVRFDAAAISGQTVSSAALELYLSSIRESGEISVHAITSSWSEATVTWNTQPPAEAVATAIRSLTTGDAGGTVAIDVTAAVQRWADGSLADAGFLIVTSDGIKAHFDAKERPGGVRAALQVVTTESPPSTGGELPTVLDLSTVPLLIDEPGHYVLDRDWRIDAAFAYKLIEIEANDVTLNFQGFGLYMLSEGDVVTISGNNVVLRDGTIVNHNDSTGVLSSGDHTVLEHMFIWAEGVGRLGARAVVRNSGFLGRGGLSVDSDSVVEFSTFLCFLTCLYADGDNIRLTDSTLDGGEYAVHLTGSDNIVARNTIIAGEAGGDGGLWIDGHRNTVEANVIKPRFSQARYPAILVNGTGNIVRSNLALPDNADRRWGVGVRFLQDGNYYGNNQMAAIVPFDLGTTVQIDWGGNIGF